MNTNGINVATDVIQFVVVYVAEDLGQLYAYTHAVTLWCEGSGHLFAVLIIRASNSLGQKVRARYLRICK